MKSIVIIGGGFSGSLTAINLCRLSTTPLEIFLIDKNRAPCRGIAYSTGNSSHLLNVVARNMSALADQPNHFLEWLGTRAEFLEEPPALLRERFAPRRVYGDYLHNLFQWHAGPIAAAKNIRMEMVADEASDLVMEDDRASVTLKSGRKIVADKVVLAVGNQPPAPFRLRGLDVKSPRYIGNPWMGWEKQLPARDQDVLLIGTGLTMVDTFLTLQDLGWQGKIFAVSRNGLLPFAHYKGFDYPDYLASETGPLGLRQMFALFKKQWRAAQAAELNPAIVVDKLRPHTQRIWQGFSLFEKRQFNCHFRTRWNVVRHRIAPEIHRQLTDAIAQGRLEIIKGRLAECGEFGSKIRVGITGKSGGRTIEGGALINCTGPQESYLPSASSLFNNLFSRGTIQPDDMNMGIKVAPNFAVVDAAGTPSKLLFALGSLLKGTLWESIAVPELRSQAFRVAELLAHQLGEGASVPPAIAEVLTDGWEYSI